MKLLYKTLLKKKTKSNYNIDSDKFASFFINKIKAIYDDIELLTSNHNRYNYLNGLTTHSITSNPISIISPEYIETIIKSSHFKTCIYIDNITLCQLKKNINYFCLTYSELINKCIEQSHFPILIKHTIITPILKNSSLDKTLTKHYRPIYNLSFLSKIIEKIIANHLTNHITNNNLDNPRKTAYKRKHNTETLLLYLTKYISYNIHINKYVIPIQLDLTAAFDTINHMILYKKLKSIGIHQSIIQLIRSYITGRTFNIKSNKQVNTYNCPEIGVPQGSVLGPLLFNIYRSDINSIINSHDINYHMYADYTQLYTSTTFNNLNETLTKIYKLTTELEIYFNNNYLKFNKLKTDCIILHSKRLIPLPLTHINIANTEIEIKTNITTLGVILDKHLTLNTQISYIVKQCNNKLYQLKQIKHLLNQSSLKILTPLI